MNIDTTALDALFDANPDTAKGIAASYQVLLGGIPTQAGFTFLINNAVMTNFGAGPGPVFNAENIFINLANSLVQGNTTAAANFATISAGATLTDMITSLYNAIIPEADRTAEGLAFVTRPEALQFYQTAAGERGVAGDQGAAIVALASLLQIAVRDDIGVGADVNDLIAAVNDGSSQLPATGETLTDIDVADGTNFDPVVPEPEPEPEPEPQPQPQPQPNPTPPNVAPTTSPVTLVAIAEDSGARQITQAELLANVVDPDGPNLVATDLAIQTGNGVLTNNNNGTWTYTPSLNDDTQVAFSYQITDGIAAAIGATANLDITPVPENATFTSNKVGFNTANPRDSVEGVATSAADDTVISTDAFLAGATVNGQGGNDTLNLTTPATAAGIGAATGISNIDTINLLAGGDTTAVNGGAAIGVGVLDLTGSVTMTQTQHNAFTNINAPGNADQITIAAGNLNIITTDADVENYTIGDSSGNTIVFVNVTGADQTVSALSNTDAVAFSVVAPNFTGEISAEGTIDDFLHLQPGAGIANGTINNIEKLNVGGPGSNAFTNAQLNGFSTSISTTGANTAVITDAATILIDNAGTLQREDFENFTLSNNDDLVTLKSSDGDNTVNSVDLAGGRDVVNIVESSHEDNDADDYLILDNFTSGMDTIKITNAERTVEFSQTNTLFNVFNPPTGLTLRTGDIVEISDAARVTNANFNQISDGGHVETEIANAIGAVTGPAGAVIPQFTNILAVLYGTDNNAYIYMLEAQAAIPSGTDLIPANFQTELIAQVNLVGLGGLVGNDFVTAAEVP